jgi:hypothetical protein
MLWFALHLYGMVSFTDMLITWPPSLTLMLRALSSELLA